MANVCDTFCGKRQAALVATMPVQRLALYVAAQWAHCVESTPLWHPPLTQLCATKDARVAANISRAWMQRAAQRFAANTQLGQRCRRRRRHPHHHYINA